MTVAAALALAAVGTAAGTAGTVASLASIVSYPALLAFGLPPLSANMTNTVALVCTGAGAAAGSRPELAGQGHGVRKLALVTGLGGAAGAALLLLTPALAFERVAPVLIVAASLLLLRGPRPPLSRPGSSRPGRGRPRGAAGGLRAGIFRRRCHDPAGGRCPPARHAVPGNGEHARVLTAAVFAVSAYIGFFGAAGGILMLAVLTPMLAGPLARVNAVKNVIGAAANAVAAVAFAFLGHVDWAAAGPLAAGFLIGGWTGPAVVRRMPGRLLRVLIGLAGLAVAARLAVSAYR